jgi:hypothetical protein
VASTETIREALSSVEVNYSYLGRGWAERALPDWEREFTKYPGAVVLAGVRAWLADPDKKAPEMGQMHAWFKSRMPKTEAAVCPERGCAAGWRTLAFHFRTPQGGRVREITARCGCAKGVAIGGPSPMLEALVSTLEAREDHVRVVVDAGPKDRMPMRDIAPLGREKVEAMLRAARDAPVRKDWTRDHERRQDGDEREEG